MVNAGIEYSCENCQAVFPNPFFTEKNPTFANSGALVQVLLHLNRVHGFRGVFSGDIGQRPKGYQRMDDTRDNTKRNDDNGPYNAVTYTQDTSTGLLKVTIRSYFK